MFRPPGDLRGAEDDIVSRRWIAGIRMMKAEGVNKPISPQSELMTNRHLVSCTAGCATIHWKADCTSAARLYMSGDMAALIMSHNAIVCMDMTSGLVRAVFIQVWNAAKTPSSSGLDAIFPAMSGSPPWHEHVFCMDWEKVLYSLVVFTDASNLPLVVSPL